MSRVALCLTLFALVSSASAQIVYEPVQYQFNAGGTVYYYGGNDPRVHELAAEPTAAGAVWGRVNGIAFNSADINTHREVTNEPPRVYTDALPMRNAAVYGFTANDARNEAYANAPRYFAKRDLLNTAVRKDGAWIVPANAHPVSGAKYYGPRGQTTQPAIEAKPLMIIPKDLLENPKPSDKQVAAAN